MTSAKLPGLPWIVLGVALVLLVLDAGSGPTWDASTTHAIVAARMDRLAGAPLYHLLAGVAALVPAGEVGFRLGLLSALIGAVTLAGVVAAVRALVPREAAASLIAVLLLAISRGSRGCRFLPSTIAPRSHAASTRSGARSSSVRRSPTTRRSRRWARARSAPPRSCSRPRPSSARVFTAEKKKKPPTKLGEPRRRDPHWGARGSWRRLARVEHKLQTPY